MDTQFFSRRLCSKSNLRGGLFGSRSLTYVNKTIRRPFDGLNDRRDPLYPTSVTADSNTYQYL